MKIKVVYSIFLQILQMFFQVLRFLERQNVSVFVVLNFISAWSHAAENRSSACWRLCWEDASSINLSANS